MGYRELTACPICEYSGKFAQVRAAFGPTFVTESGFNAAYYSAYSICPVCGDMFQNPMPNMTGFYESGDYRESVNASTEAMDADELARSERVFKTIKEYLPAPTSFLDVGASRGYLLDKIKEGYGILPIGIEPNFSYVTNLHVVARDISDVGGPFDLITCIHVLEHVPTPVYTLRQMYNRLTRDGTLMIEVPTIASPASPFRLPHLHVFDTGSLETAARKAGMRIDRLFFGTDLMVTLKGLTQDSKIGYTHIQGDIP
jgi:cyclopropane fatty-acyl-phospholipid synthase-like methyltransferase